MPEVDLAALFDDYRHRGDPDALARVFDLTAPRLLLVAVHLAGDRGEAEDLVQATFLAAIEDAPRYDRTRPLLPWLVGILARRAAAAARRRRQPDPQRLPPQPSTDPAHQAELHERAEQVLRALDGVPSQYRHVLVLHLVHELAPVQIARSLGRPPETVRTQLRRGLSLLRERLPAQLGATAVLVAAARAQRDGLAAVREQVLLHAARHTTAAATVAAAGGTALAWITGMLTIKTLAAAAALGAVCATALLLGRGDRTAAPSVADAPAAAGARPLATGAAAAAPTPATATAREPAGPTAAAFVGVEVRGRCVDAASARPWAAGCTVRLESGGPLGFVQRAIAVTETAADGTFVLRVAGPATVPGVWISARTAGCVAAAGALGDLPAGTDLDVGDVSLRRGAVWVGTVVDEDGTVVPAASVAITTAHDHILAGNRRFSGHHARSASDGSFRLGDDDPLPAGTWSVETDDELQLLRPRNLVVPQGATVVTPQVVVRRRDPADSLAGTVVDDLGQPVKGVSVEVPQRGPDSSSAAAPWGATRDDGRFTLWRGDDAPPEVELYLHGRRELVARRHGPFRWGQTDLRLMVERARPLRVRVVGADTGQPLRRFAVHSKWSGDADAGASGPYQYPGEHDDGTFEVAGIARRGRLTLLLQPADERYSTHLAALDLAAVGDVAEIAIRPRRELRVRVTLATAEGEPAVGSTVELVRVPPAGALHPTAAVAGPDSATWLLDDRRGLSQPMQLGRATTDADGRAVLAADDLDGLALRVQGSAHAPVVVEPLAVPAPGIELAVVAPVGAGLVGHTVPADAAARFALGAPEPYDGRPRLGLLLRRSDDPQSVLPGRGDVFAIGADGRFAVHGVPAGRYAIELSWWRWYRPSMAGTQLVAGFRAEVELLAGEQSELELDLRGHLPGRVCARVLAEGAPLAGAKVFLQPLDETGAGLDHLDGGVGPWRTADDGTFATYALPAGSYRLVAESVGEDGALRRWTAVDPVTVVAGQDGDGDLVVVEDDRRQPR